MSKLKSAIKAKKEEKTESVVEGSSSVLTRTAHDVVFDKSTGKYSEVILHYLPDTFVVSKVETKVLSKTQAVVMMKMKKVMVDKVLKK